MKLRLATPADALALTQLAMVSKAHWGYPESFMAACRDELTVDPDSIRSGRICYVLAEHEGAIAGFHGLMPVDDDCWELEALFVHPDRMGQGIGRKLLADACERARAAGGKRLVIQGDPHAEGFYLRAGAKRVGSLPSLSIRGRELPLFEIDLGAA